MEPVCRICRWWQDYSTRVYARISDVDNSNQHRGIIELRLCKYIPSPSVTWESPVYTDAAYVCSDFMALKGY